jgi:hypothetical protein
MVTPKGKREGRKLLKKISDFMPVAHPVKLIFTSISADCWAEIYTIGDETPVFIIRISKEIEDSLVMDTLLHEYAHACSWYWESTQHGPAFGIAQARLWSFIQD